MDRYKVEEGSRSFDNISLAITHILNNHATNCVHHIKQNLKQQFGPVPADLVFPIATSFSTIREETLLLELQTGSRRAYEYLDKIPILQWHTTQWVMTRKLPLKQRL